MPMMRLLPDFYLKSSALNEVVHSLQNIGSMKGVVVGVAMVLVSNLHLREEGIQAGGSNLEERGGMGDGWEGRVGVGRNGRGEEGEGIR